MGAITVAVVAFAASGSAFRPPSLGHAALNARANALPALFSDAAAREAARAARAGGLPGMMTPSGAPTSRPPPRRPRAPPQQAPGPPPDYTTATRVAAPVATPVAAVPVAVPVQRRSPGAGTYGAPPAAPAERAHGAAAAAAEDARLRGVHQSNAQIDEDVAMVLAEFCQSSYARSICAYCNANPTDYGNIWGMFSSVVCNGDSLAVRLGSNFEQRSTQLLDKLARHLRARLPELRQLQCEKRSPPTTETIMLAYVPARVAE